MLKITDYNTFEDKTVDEIIIKVTHLSINRNDNEDKLNFNITIMSGVDNPAPASMNSYGIPASFSVDYDTTVSENPFETAYKYLMSLSSCENGVRV